MVCLEISSQSSFRHPIPLVPGNADYSSGTCPPRREQFPPNAAAATSHLECGRRTAMSYGPTGPMNVSHIYTSLTGDRSSPFKFTPQPNAQGEQPWGPGASFTGHPAAPTDSTCPPNFQPPQVYARPNAQGIPSPTWQLSQSWIDYEGGEDLRLIILFKKIQST